MSPLLHDRTVPFRPPVAKLPQWIASFDIQAAEREHRSRTDNPESASPLAIHNPDECCQIARFGADGRSLALFDGYLYGRVEMLQELEASAPVSTEAALVALAYQRWGEALFERLNGRFLVAVWDAATHTFWLSHDALGNHPVYYARNEGRLWFSPNVLALAHSGFVERRPNRLSLAMVVRRARAAAGETFFQDIARLPPARCLRWRIEGEPALVRFWDPYPGDEAQYLSDDEAIQQFETVFERVVADRIDLGATGIFLSGGLDSCVVAAAAAEATSERGAEPVTAWSMQGHPEDPPGYEEETQARVATFLGLGFVRTSWYECLGERDLVRASLEEMSDYPTPTWGYWTGGYMSVKREAVRQGFTHFLTGSGGDEWFSVNPVWAADLMLGVKLGRLGRLIRVDTDGSWPELSESARWYLWTHGLRAILAAGWKSLAPGSFEGYLHRRARQRMAARSIGGIDGRTYPDPAIDSNVADLIAGRLAAGVNPRGRFPKQFAREIFWTGWPDSPVAYDREYEYHASRLSGVVNLSPFHDRRLVELARRMPPWMAMRKGRDKGLVREYADERLTGLGLGDRSKKVAALGPNFWHRLLPQRLPVLFGQIGCQRLAEMGLVEPSIVAKQMARCHELEHWDHLHLFSILSAEVWVAAQFDSNPVGP